MKKRKILLLIITLLITNIINCYASTNTFDRNELENYGVRKNWTINDSNLQNILNTPAVDSDEKVYDYADILSEEEEIELKEHIYDFIEKTKMDMIIVTKEMEYPESFKNYCYNEDLADEKVAKYNETFAANFYDYNDFGMDFENNSGILLMRNTAIDPCFNAMYYDMYTFGNAQLYFTQTRYDSILDGIYDDVHSENYLEGFIDFIDRTESYIISGTPSDLEDYYVDDNGYLQKHPETYSIPWGISFLVALIVTSITIGIMISRNKMVKKARTAEEYLNKESLKITNRQDIFLVSHTSSYTTSSSSGGSSGGFSSSRGSSGGGHSSGGGRHG